MKHYVIAIPLDLEEDVPEGATDEEIASIGLGRMRDFLNDTDISAVWIEEAESTRNGPPEGWRVVHDAEVPE